MSSAFTVAHGRRHGLTRWDLESALFERPFHGLRAPRHTEADEHPAATEQMAIIRAARHFTAHMNDHEFFSHSTAALLWGVPLPRLGRTEVHVSVLAPHRAPRGSGVRGHQLAARAVRLVHHSELGLALTDPATTWALLGHELRHPYDLVAAADAFVRVDRMPGPGSRVIRPALASIADLRRAIPPGRRGVLALREALGRVRVGSASRMETWMRLTVVDAGLPEPVLDHDVYDALGRFLGCVDGAYPFARVALEYEGDHHRTDERQWQRDIVKHDDLARAGWRVIRLTREQVFGQPGRLAARVRDALRASAR
ncbi:hypothetical protein SAMN04487846_1354 [Microbacterium sp. cf046]|nr:hypothetical protein SAMN04487846_1354 [Microbacterium sp. cf046]